MIFLLEGEFTVEFQKNNSGYCYKSGEQNLSCYSNQKSKINLSQGQHKVLRVNLAPEFFKQYLPKESNFDCFKQLIEQKKTGRLQ